MNKRGLIMLMSDASFTINFIETDDVCDVTAVALSSTSLSVTWTEPLRTQPLLGYTVAIVAAGNSGKYDRTNISK